jgi:hypothetical protein
LYYYPIKEGEFHKMRPLNLDDLFLFSLFLLYRKISGFKVIKLLFVFINWYFPLNF